MSTLVRALRTPEKPLAYTLKGFATARISWPSPARQLKLARRVEAHEPLLKHTFGIWLHGVFDTGTICFAEDGCIIWSRHNCRASRNDSDTSLGLRAKLLDPKFCPVSRMNVVSDSAFPCSTELTGRILTPLKDGDIDRILPSLRSGLCTLHNAITSVRQSIEWDMGSMQQPPQSPAPYNPELRGLRIANIFRMSNYRVRTVVIS
ncbi:hypothetical protein F442_22901 [Phytophthora nicotianae P10297]|uniref:DDE Tnp4 domain-containing protein n=1 Tax=Phytophthora nicotianae P10297 TaxID=1317064 RepID=W2Y0V4_PHYNI|nr:hypothetical protein F442_22901 [Phytophthora nicotianae P10297]